MVQIYQIGTILSGLLCLLLLVHGILDECLSLSSKAVNVLLSCSSLVRPERVCLLSHHILNHLLYLLIWLSSIKVEIHGRNNLLIFPIILPSVSLLIPPLSNRSIPANILTMPPPSWHIAVLVGTALVVMYMCLCIHFGLFKTLLFFFFSFGLPLFKRFIKFLTDVNLNARSLSVIQIWNTHLT